VAAVGVGGDREAVRDAHAKRTEIPDQLPERGVLAAHAGDHGEIDLFEGDAEGGHGQD
jgi:hypothetical protein